MFDDTYFMREAYKEALKAYDDGEIPVGVVIVARDRIIARGHNLTERLNDVTAHAEMMSITAAANAIGGKYLKGCRVFITLEPCSMCAGALYWAQPDEVIFGAADEKNGYRTRGGSLHPKTRVREGLMANESADLLRDFFKSRRK
ncbi:MAG: nucleoside deaminase [Flavobacteriales bacterium]|nr:MAG: nucleoside deaminase [Flavobacteriales bacterium]